MSAFLQSHGGVMAVAILAVVLFNVLMSALAQAFTALGKQEPQWMQTAGSWGVKVAQWLSANTPTSIPSVQITKAPTLTTPPKS